jgi:hypothetical protein
MKYIINKYTASSFLALLCLIILSSAFANEPSPEELLRQANEIRLQAMKGHCEKVGNRIAACYTDKSECDKMHNSIAWFTSEYGESPEIACVVDSF